MGTELERLAALAVAEAGGPHPCHLLGHKWRLIGGRNAWCDDYCECGVPVHQCDGCGDYDYGDNDEAREVMARCARLGND